MFKVGDVVERIWPDFGGGHGPLRGSFGTVSSVSPDGKWIGLKEFPSENRDPEPYDVNGFRSVAVVREPQVEQGTNPKDLLGIKKVQLNLVPASSTIYQALAMEDGAVKYGPFNWRTKKVKASIYVAAAIRHIQAWFDGEENASDSGKPHLGHALACLGILADAKETGNLADDRPVPGPAAKLIATWEQKKKENK